MEHTRLQLRQHGVERCEYGLHYADIAAKGAAEFAKLGSMAARLLSIAVAARRPALELDANYPPPLAGEVPSTRLCARRKGGLLGSPYRLAAVRRSTSPASGGG